MTFANHTSKQAVASGFDSFSGYSLPPTAPPLSVARLSSSVQGLPRIARPKRRGVRLRLFRWLQPTAYSPSPQPLAFAIKPAFTRPEDRTVPGKLVLVRHGQSAWNLENLFTGWVDVDLTEQGRGEAREAGRLLKAEGIEFDLIFTSVLKRAIRTMWAILDEMDLMWLPVERAWQLNERHYGALQGLDKAQTVAKHGAEQVKIWRRSYDIPPPPLALDDKRHPRFERRYAALKPEELPATESLKTTLDRVQPYWDRRIAPELKAGRNVMIVAHGNSLRALVKMLDGMSDADIVEFNIPTGVPIVYELTNDLKPATPRRFLGDQAAIKAAADAVAKQTEKK